MSMKVWTNEGGESHKPLRYTIERLWYPKDGDEPVSEYIAYVPRLKDAHLLASVPDLQGLIADLAEALEETHQDEYESNHGDDATHRGRSYKTCSYCRLLKRADKAGR